MLRDATNKFDIEKAEVISISGAHVPRIKAEIKSKNHHQKYQQVCVVVGGTDVEPPRK